MAGGPYFDGIVERGDASSVVCVVRLTGGRQQLLYQADCPGGQLPDHGARVRFRIGRSPARRLVDVQVLSARSLR